MILLMLSGQGQGQSQAAPCAQHPFGLLLCRLPLQRWAHAGLMLRSLPCPTNVWGIFNNICSVLLFRDTVTCNLKLMLWCTGVLLIGCLSSFKVQSCLLAALCYRSYSIVLWPGATYLISLF